MTISSPRWDSQPGKTTPPYWIIAQAISSKQLWWDSILNNLYTESRRDAYRPTHVFLQYMMTSSNEIIFRVTGPLCGDFTRSPVNSPHKGQWRGALVFSIICAWMNGWVNNGETSDLRRHRAHYDVIVMTAFFRCGTSRGVASDAKPPPPQPSCFSIHYMLGIAVR